MTDASSAGSLSVGVQSHRDAQTRSSGWRDRNLSSGGTDGHRNGLIVLLHRLAGRSGRPRGRGWKSLCHPNVCSEGPLHHNPIIETRGKYVIIPFFLMSNVPICEDHDFHFNLALGELSINFGAKKKN